MKKLSVLVALLVFAFPAVASAKGGADHRSAAKQCKSIRAEMGAEAFRAAFGNQNSKRAMKRCVAKQRKATKAATRRARKSCKASGKRGRALKRCVRGKLAAEPPSAAPEGHTEAVDECKSAQEEDPEGFADEYGEGSEALEQCIAAHTDEPEGETSEGDGDDPVDEEPGQDEIVEEPDAEPV